ncbi:hypothetical protein TcCL_ESM11250 [Trypanosoma cruzi]|nr:hypothetical protein TcCL_ESM11250 [Trypanosoma cruzi]
MSQSSWQHLPSTALSVTIRMTAKRAMRIMGDDLHRGADYLRVLVHESQEGLNAVSIIPGITEPLAFALSPAVISAPCVDADPFTVEFTQQLSSVFAAGPALALSHVFQRCLACNLMSVLSRPPPPVFFFGAQ